MAFKNQKKNKKHVKDLHASKSNWYYKNRQINKENRIMQRAIEEMRIQEMNQSAMIDNILKYS